MKRFVEGVDRGQSTLFPECLDDWIGRDICHLRLLPAIRHFRRRLRTEIISGSKMLATGLACGSVRRGAVNHGE